MGSKMIREGLLLEDPTPVDRCLGCHHAKSTGRVNCKPVKVMQFNVESFMQQCVQAYKDLCGEPDMKLLIASRIPPGQGGSRQGSKQLGATSIA